MSQNRKNILKFIAFCMFATIALALLSGFTRHEIVYRLESYTVQSNERLETVASKFIVKNTATVRRLDEFGDGIRQLNYGVIGDGEVKEGQVLQIGYWIKK